MIFIEELLSKEEVSSYREALNSVPWNDGRETAAGMAADVKSNAQAYVNSEQVQQLTNGLLAKMGGNTQLVSAVLPNKIFPPCFNRYTENDTYGYHVDAAIMRMPNSQEVLRSDMSMTLFLSEPEEYEGGELTITTEFGTHAVKRGAGDAVIYPSSSLHQVSPVTKGVRFAAVSWMQSLVSDQVMRQTLYELDQVIQSLSSASSTNRIQLDQLHCIYHNLIRQQSNV